MKNYLSIIIAHFLPENNIANNPLQKTIFNIENEKFNGDIEIIISDDGSIYSKDIMTIYSKKRKYNNRDIFILEGDALVQFLKKINIKSKHISKWIYLPKEKECMSKAKVVNFATKSANYNKFLFLDDDNYFISQNSINNLFELFLKYSFIVGQIKDNNGRLRSYNSRRVQGTTIAITKECFEEVNGFGEWTEEFSCGVDSDFWFNIFRVFNNNKKYLACYTNRISTYDSYSKRWKKYTNLFRDIYLKREFKRRYNCKNYKSSKYNLSRKKEIWIDNLIEK